MLLSCCDLAAAALRTTIGVQSYRWTRVYAGILCKRINLTTSRRNRRAHRTPSVGILAARNGSVPARRLFVVGRGEGRVGEDDRDPVEFVDGENADVQLVDLAQSFGRKAIRLDRCWDSCAGSADLVGCEDA